MQKNHHWDKLTDSFNAETWFQLTKQTLKNKIDNLKKNTKERAEVVKTSGGHLQLGFGTKNMTKCGLLHRNVPVY